jgi:hypothetical protein
VKRGGTFADSDCPIRAVYQIRQTICEFGKLAFGNPLLVDYNWVGDIQKTEDENESKDSTTQTEPGVAHLANL